MTWITPSLAWMLYRSGYGAKPGQERVLKIKLTHEAVVHLLSECQLKQTGTDEAKETGRVQWDPERSLYQSEPGKKEPMKLSGTRAIQIGIGGSLSERYVDSIVSIEEVTDLAHKFMAAHALKS